MSSPPTASTTTTSNEATTNPPPEPTKAPTNTVTNDIDDETDDQPLLVTEFPPPPYYYRQASTLTPPPIPHEALHRASQRAAAKLQKAKEESERIRLAAEAGEGGDGAEGGVDPTRLGTTEGAEATAAVDDEEDDPEAVAVFGEYVEDPLLAPVEDLCQDPTKIKEQVKKLNKQILQGFVQLVGELVNRPLEHKKVRDELSHNIFLMLQECNKFREHQAREVLIDTLEGQLKERREALEELKREIASTDEALVALDKIKKAET